MGNAADTLHHEPDDSVPSARHKVRVRVKHVNPNDMAIKEVADTTR